MADTRHGERSGPPRHGAPPRHGERSGPTRHGARSDTKATKATKNTKKTKWIFFVPFVAFVFFVAERGPWAVSPRAQQADQTPQKPPVFRAGAHYVRVDAYPTGKDGKIIQGLTKDDFEVFEDGKPQTIEQADFITFDTWTPDAERKDPRTQQDAYDLAADPAWRVFVIVIDPAAYGLEGRHHMRGPLHEFLDRNLGPRDLFGLLTTESEWTDLVLGQKTTAAKAVIDSRQSIHPPEYDERFMPLYECGLGSLVPVKKLDDTYLLLEGLVKLLGLVRQERKSIVLVTNGLSSPGPGRGNNIMTPPDLPRIPGPHAPIGGIARPGDRVGTLNRSRDCAGERMRLTNLNFADRFRELLRDARRANVAFYPISPVGLQTMPFKERGGIDMNAYRLQTRRTDSLHVLANETDGMAIVNTNDLAGGMRRIAADVQAYYVLGYYTNNTTCDGKVRSIKVRLKPKRDSIRARRQYRAPTMEEIAAFSAPPSVKPPTAEETALKTLERHRANAFMTYAARSGDELSVILEVPAGGSAWPAGTEIVAMAESADGDILGSARAALKAPGRLTHLKVPLDARKPVSIGMIKVRAEGLTLTDRVMLAPATTLVGDPIALRNGTPAAVLACTRTDAIRLEWPMLRPMETRQVRLLDRRGQPLKIPVSVVEAETGGTRRLVTELSLAPLARGDYLVELTVSSDGVSERKLFPLQVK